MKHITKIIWFVLLSSISFAKSKNRDVISGFYKTDNSSIEVRSLMNPTTNDLYDNKFFVIVSSYNKDGKKCITGINMKRGSRGSLVAEDKNIHFRIRSKAPTLRVHSGIVTKGDSVRDCQIKGSSFFERQMSYTTEWSSKYRDKNNGFDLNSVSSSGVLDTSVSNAVGVQ